MGRKSKSDKIIRPQCTKPLKFDCVCGAVYTNPGNTAHIKCYRKYCSHCCLFFKTEIEMKKHALQKHQPYFCNKCNAVFMPRQLSPSDLENFKKRFQKDYEGWQFDEIVMYDDILLRHMTHAINFHGLKKKF